LEEFSKIVDIFFTYQRLWKFLGYVP